MEIINLDMVPGKKSPVCHASQYDDGRVIRFNLYDSGLPFTLDGTETITFEVRKPDGNIVTSTLTNTSDSYVDVVTTEQMTAVKGANLCEVRVEKGGTNIGSLNVIMAVEMDPTDGGIASASAIDNLRSQISGMVAEEVAEQYDAGSVIFDSAPTPGHGNGYAVTSEGVNNALAPKADRSELPDMSNYYNKTETDTLLDDKADVSDLPDMSNYYTKTETDTALDDKVNTSDFAATNLPISGSDTTDTKTYIDNGLNEKADTSSLSTVATSGDFNDLLNKPLTFGGTLTDLNNSSRVTKTCTLYVFGGGATNSPSGTAGGWLISLINENTVNYGSQLALTNGGLFFRKLSGGSFQAWTTLAT